MVLLLIQTKTNAIAWNPREPMNFTAVSVLQRIVMSWLGSIDYVFIRFGKLILDFWFVGSGQ